MSTSSCQLITHETSTEAIYQLLNEVIKKPAIFINNPKIRTALQSQGGIAKLEGTWAISDHTINKKNMTLNTLKKHSKNLLGNKIDDGWCILNELRINAKEAIDRELEKEKKPTKRTKIGLQEVLKANEDALKKQKEVNLILLQALSGAMQTMKIVSDTPNKELREERAQRGLERLRAIVSLNQPPYNKLETSPKVVVITKSDTNE
ncbi:TPA: hypothetical protein NKA96_004836 [Vibrio parahaemolyticus]|nr:hypothetical protein [Vibrio parahaemolyticus]EKB1967892.1 hypothetical protein [Vibrio parahaemolyticus]HCG8444193.1 hypothetical protein [Vibrio parahaemolyticus]HCG8445829.1 hypothetical protein [Vibrio parahaemolyticus]HCG8617182.1 hypothetical protein [Vibrio parahaemolyticus]